MTEQEWREEFSKRVKYKMDLLNMSQRELAKRSGVAEGSLSRYLGCLRTPRADTVVNISKALKCKVAELIEVGEMIY